MNWVWITLWHWVWTVLWHWVWTAPWHWVWTAPWHWVWTALWHWVWTSLWHWVWTALWDWVWTALGHWVWTVDRFMALSVNCFVAFGSKMYATDKIRAVTQKNPGAGVWETKTKTKILSRWKVPVAPGLFKQGLRWGLAHTFTCFFCMWYKFIYEGIFTIKKN